MMRELALTEEEDPLERRQAFVLQIHVCDRREEPILTEQRGLPAFLSVHHGVRWRTGTALAGEE